MVGACYILATEPRPLISRVQVVAISSEDEWWNQDFRPGTGFERALAYHRRPVIDVEEIVLSDMEDPDYEEAAESGTAPCLMGELLLTPIVCRVPQRDGGLPAADRGSHPTLTS